MSNERGERGERNETMETLDTGASAAPTCPAHRSQPPMTSGPGKTARRVLARALVIADRKSVV